ncbi:hypothetical protein [Streptomyces sp. PKU-EA00015]|uniref:hypothetical protein n=1 Tax=Streptomyces sp. PKU-EA00015 TaxID=2748326 RepID=UPI002108B76A|nr:hypothetical protein [Streptomyces sp. PKU-EA00015]
MKRLLRAGAVTGGLALAAAIGLAGATPAAAASCSTNDACLWLYFNSENRGSSFLTTTSISNLAGYKYTAPGAGQGQYVKNNAASASFRADNNFYASSGTVFYRSGYGGPCDKLQGSENQIKWAPRLVRTYNENASVKIVSGLWGDHPSTCYNW